MSKKSRRKARIERAKKEERFHRKVEPLFQKANDLLDAFTSVVRWARPNESDDTLRMLTEMRRTGNWKLLDEIEILSPKEHLERKALQLWDQVVGDAVVVPEAPAVDEGFWLKPGHHPASK